MLRGLDLAAAARYVGLDPGSFSSFVESGKLLRTSAAAVAAYETDNTVKARRED